jgi:4,5-DOPA dioxygenase extradiol
MPQKIKSSELMPVFFIGHGSPMNAIETNPFTKSLEALGREIKQKPSAILVISAHWLTDDSYVSISKKPETIYDFYGFPDELYQVKYPAPGAPGYAGEVKKLIPQVKEDNEWGLDHGAWSVLRHLFPKADIPCLQLSIDFYKPMQYHYDIAEKLKPLRNKGVLIIGSGNIVHNLRMIYTKEDLAPYDWAVEFDLWVKDKINKRDIRSLIHYEKAGQAAQMSVPTVDHYVPLLYSLAPAEHDEEIEFTYEEVFSSLSMRCLRIG